MPLYILTILLQVIFVIHVIRTGRDTKWVFIVLFLPIAGAIAYFIIEVLPGLRHNRTVRRAASTLQKSIDTQRDVRQHSEALDVANTVENTLNLARTLREKKQYGEALALYEKTLAGMYADDPYILLGKAETLYAMDNFPDTIAVLDLLIAKNPDFKSPDGHLLYAKALEGSGNVEKAIPEYEALCSYYSGPEPKCRYAGLLKARGDTEKAKSLLNEVLVAAKRHHKHYNNLHKEWVEYAKRELRGL